MEMVGGCCVCLDERGWDENPLVYCDGHGCNVAVHQGDQPHNNLLSRPATFLLGPLFCGPNGPNFSLSLLIFSFSLTRAKRILRTTVVNSWIRTTVVVCFADWWLVLLCVDKHYYGDGMVD